MSAPTKLIVMVAFDRDQNTGELVPAFEPREMRDEDQARRQAQMLASQHDGVIAWVRSADLALGEFGPPEVIYQAGEVPEME